jgi:hypothetical protein
MVTPISAVGIAALRYRARMTDADPPDVHLVEIHEQDSVVIHQRTATAVIRAAGTAPAVAAVALITATATLLNMSVANDIGDARLYNTSTFAGLVAIRWAAGTRLALAVIALLLVVFAGVRYARDLPATRYTFSADGEEATDSTEGVDAPTWVTVLVGAAALVSVLAVVLNAVALLIALHTHQSPIVVGTQAG